VKPGTGSARSVPGFHLHQALTACSEHLIGFGGHAAAAGLRIDESSIDHFRGAFCEWAAAEISAEDRVAELFIDAETALHTLTFDAVCQIERLAPFGQGNPRPVLCATNVEVAQPPKTMGGGGRHLSVVLGQHGKTFRSVAFGRGDACDELAQADGPLAIAFKPVINNFRGRRTVELHLADWRIAKTAPVAEGVEGRELRVES